MKKCNHIYKEIISALAHRCIGALVHRHIGASAHWHIGTLAYWHIGALILLVSCQTQPALEDEDGSRLWLRYDTTANATVNVSDTTATLRIAAYELRHGWKGDPVTLTLKNDGELAQDGFRIRCADGQVSLASPSEVGLLYGAYHLLRLQECQQPVTDATENPAYALRILNHWDNPDRTVERGYAGQSLWDWNTLDSLSTLPLPTGEGVGGERLQSYAQANASIGINGTVLNNVNASPAMLSDTTLTKVKRLADLFRPYGLRVYLSVNFATPMVLGGLPTADPLDEQVRQWWSEKANEIYRLIPDFGGFLVKANSEGQPGPCDFGRTHAEGANMLADVLAPYGGIVMWRAFVYSPSDADRAKQAYAEFQPLDGQFRENVILQVKNGPIDFQPREPYSPLFTSMQHTPLMAEFQITQEYLGHSNHLVYLAPMWEEFFRYVQPASLQAIAGVANIGTAANWCGHPFAQANWYAFGRLAWNPALTSQEIAREWLCQTFTPTEAFVQPVTDLMLRSREATVDYMMPLGLHHQFAWGHHYGPEPWCAIEGARPDWMPSYYHRADSLGIGFDRSHTGSNAVSQYPDSLARLLDNPATCPEEFLLWFHHLPWTYPMRNGNTLWDELCLHYQHGVDEVRSFQQTWQSVRPYVDTYRFQDVTSRLETQAKDAIWWRDACLLYFQTHNHLPFPQELPPLPHTLDHLMSIKLPITNYECPTPEMLDAVR